MLATWQIGGVFELASVYHCSDGYFTESCELWNYPQAKCLVGEMTTLNNIGKNIFLQYNVSLSHKNRRAMAANIFQHSGVAIDAVH